MMKLLSRPGVPRGASYAICSRQSSGKSSDDARSDKRPGVPRGASYATKSSDDARSQRRLDVRVIGVGGAGCSSLNRLSDFLPGVTQFLGIDTGSGAKGLGSFADVIQVGRGFGSGGDAVLAEDMFVGSGGYRTEVSRFVTGADVVIILAGLGRGTGSGIAPLVAQAAKESGALTLAAVNMPFEFEGRFRGRIAAEALIRLRDSSDSVFVMMNDDLLNSANIAGSTLLTEAFREADENISSSVRAVVTALEASENRFDEVRRALNNAEKSVVISGCSTGLHAGKTAVELAFASISTGVDGASLPPVVRSALVHVEGGIGLSAGQIAEAVAAVQLKTGRQTECHVSSVREVVMGQQVRVTLILAGGGPEPELKCEPGPQGIERSIGHLTTASKSAWPDDLRETATESVFDTPRPVRRRGPMLLPTG